jgi:hypothetical protein
MHATVNTLILEYARKTELNSLYSSLPLFSVTVTYHEVCNMKVLRVFGLTFHFSSSQANILFVRSLARVDE